MGTNFKFYDENRLDVNDSYSFTSSDTTLSSYLYDNNYNTKLVSSGSDDLTDEVYTIDLASAVSADAIFLGNHNFKDINIEYSDDDQGTWNDFSPAINETTNTATYNFYSFTEVTGITDIKITASTTQTVNAEKSIGQFRLFSLLGEVSKNPSNIENPYAENSVIHGLSDGGNTYVQFGRKMNMIIEFPDASDADVTLFRTLKDRFSPFYVWPNGNDTTITQEPFRIQDMYLVNYVNEFHPRIKSGFLIGVGTMIDLELREV